LGGIKHRLAFFALLALAAASVSVGSASAATQPTVSTKAEVQASLSTASSSAPACVKKGFTAETNNLNLASTPTFGSEPSPPTVSKQTNGTSWTASCAVAASGATWQKAIEVPGTSSLNAGGMAVVNSVSCASAGSCSAGGNYTDSHNHSQAFVVSEVGGAWGKAVEVPGSATLNAGGSAVVNSVSCASAGNCSAGGLYADSSHDGEAFVVNEANGTWGRAVEVPGSASLNTGGDAQIYSVSCGSAGNCSAGGIYAVSSGASEAFIVSEVGGTWGKAVEVPGTATLNAGGDAQINSVSCASAGNCSAGGIYIDNRLHVQAFVIGEVNSTWGKAVEVPGSATLSGGGDAWVYSVSCASAGNCSAGGSYTDRQQDADEPFAVSEVDGTWGKAVEVPGTASLNAGAGGIASVDSVSCASAGNCSAGGQYYDSSRHYQAFVVSQVDGTWGKAVEVPGSATLNKGGYAQIGNALACSSEGNCTAVSCTSAGNCSAGGSYTDSSGSSQAFVVSEVGGTWGKAVEVPGSATLNAGGNAVVNSVSCAPAGHCSAGGTYTDSQKHSQAFLVSQTAMQDPATALNLPASRLT
jgi:hypothetical protein